MHTIAHDLGYTVGELSAKMSYSEFRDWCAWYNLRNADSEKEPSGDAVNLDEMTPEQVAEFMGS